MNFTSIRTALLVVTVAAFAGCGGGKTVVESDLKIKSAPDWVNEGTNILNTKDGRLFHGIGSATPMGDTELQRSTAENRARAEVARILSSYMDVVAKDYSAAAKVGDNAELQQSVTRSIESLTQVNLTGVRIIANWRSDKDGTIYSLAELDMRHMKDILKNVQDMNEGLRAHIVEHADNLFDSIAVKK
jgi:hypothetical protein